MRLIECYIENFGMLHEHTHKFNAGLNTVYEHNGAGKTTLGAFLKAMLYGFSESRKTSLDENERAKYKPWQGGRYGGSLTFRYEDGVYRIERTFGARASEDELTVIDAASGAATARFGDEVGKAIFGIDREGFAATVFLSERSIGGKIVNESISSKLSELVGADGDVGGFKAAIDVLEKRRKFYEKRGGGGEIPSLRAKIAECDLELAALDRRREEAKGYELSLAKLEAELAALGEERILLEGKLAEERAMLTQKAKTEQYRIMLENLEAEKRNLAKLGEYFAEGVPAGWEIDAARDAANEAKRLREETKCGSPELAELSEFFRRDTDFAQIDGMFRTETRRESAVAERDLLRERVAIAEDSKRRQFGDVSPEPQTIERHARMLAKSSALPLVIVLLCCIVPVAFLGALISPWLYLVAIPLAIGAIIIGTKRASEVKAANGYAAELGVRGDDISDKLFSLAARLREGDALTTTNLERIAALERDIAEDEARITDFIGAYPHGAASTREALEIINEKYRRYYTLKLHEDETRLGREMNEEKIRSLEARASAFLAKYRTEGDNPFEEIRVKANTYNFAKMTVERGESECATYARLHGIDPSELVADGSVRDESAAVLIRENGDKITEARRQHTLLSRTYDECQAECDRADEVRANREAYSERLAKYSENFEVIKLSEKMLTDACDNMTSKYIGGTRERFMKYESLIGEEAGEYAIDTDFVITKNDRGGTRQMESYSRGTRDLHAFALRLALIDSLYEGNCPLIILDDPFASFDDKRLAGAKSMIKALAREKQIIYFTCTKERAI